MEKNRQWYFGTYREPGHYLLDITGPGIPREEYEKFVRFVDGELWMRNFYTEHYRRLVNGRTFYYSRVKILGETIWSVVGVPWSIDDRRHGCHTEYWKEGEHELQDLVSDIQSHDLLKRQFKL